MRQLFSDTLMAVNSVPRIYFVSASLRNWRVPTIDQIYRDNLRVLVNEFGTQDALATQLEKSPAQLSQWINASKDSKSGKPRRLSTDMARYIEVRCGKPAGWMDEPHAPPQQDPGEPQLPGQRYDALSPDEQRFIENLREIQVDEDEWQHLLHEVASKAAKIRSLREKLLAPHGIRSTPARHAADAKMTAIARAALDVTDRLRQTSFFDPPSEE